MSYRSKIKICGIKSAAEARAVLACSSALYANLESADGAKNSSQSGGESSIKTPNFCGENSRQNFNPDVENFARNSGSKDFTQNFNQGGENFTCRTQNHVNFTPDQNSNCDKNFCGDSRNLGDGSGVRVDFLGVIFVSSSKRRVSIETAREIAHIAHENGAKCVGVFAGQSDCEIMEICEFAALDVAQIHGEVSSNLYANLKAMGLEIWRVYSVLDALPAVDTALCDMPLFDCKGENAGGNGISFDWEILREVKFDFGMAGGIGEHNAREAIKFNPRVLDLNSKVEDENGIKNIIKILNILEIIR